MADAAIFVGWGPVIPGREQKALQVFNEALQYYTRLQQQGQIESFETVALEPHGGDLAGCIIIRGDKQKLSQVRSSDEFTRLSTRALLVVTNFGAVGGYIGEGLNRLFADFQQQAAELAG
jgi:hypothetical protein